MSAYYFYTMDGDVFSQLTTSPTSQQGDVLADFICEELDTYLEDFEDESAGKMWPADQAAMSQLIVKRLALPDWYSDLSYDDATMWDNILFSLQDEPGQQIGIDFQPSNYEGIYEDCVQLAAKFGASMMAEPKFGNSGFRYFGKPSSKYSAYPMYTIYTHEQVTKLLAQLAAIETHFDALSDDEEWGPREQFLEGLFPTVHFAAENGRVLWVQTDA